MVGAVIARIDPYRFAAAGGGGTISESFDKADGDGLGPDLTWTEGYSGGSADANWEIVSNNAQLVQTSEEQAWAQTDGSSLTDNVYVEVLGATARMAGGNAYCGAGVVARAGTIGALDAWPDGYTVYVGEKARTVYLVKGDGTVLDSVATGLGNTGYTFDLRIECDGTSITGEVTETGTPTTWTVTATDSTHTTGDVGIFGQVGQSAGGSDEPTFPAFEAGDL